MCVAESGTVADHERDIECYALAIHQGVHFSQRILLRSFKEIFNEGVRLDI